jgi:hypothetical protein
VRNEAGELIRPDEAISHLNEVVEGAAVDALVTNRVWHELGLEPSTTLHDLRWREWLLVTWETRVVWMLEISGAVPAAHLAGGYAGATGYRQPPMYVPLSSTMAGVSKVGEIAWSRVYLKGRVARRPRLGPRVDAPGAVRGLRAEGAAFAAMGLRVQLCGVAASIASA